MAWGLQGVSWLLVVLHSIWSCVLGLEMYKFWKRRKTMRIFARSPGLALVSGFTGIAVQTCLVLQEIMAQKGKVFPCVVILYSNSVIVALHALPYLLRGLRAVILAHKVWRAKHMALVSRNNVWAVLGITFMVLNGICAILQQAIPQVYGENPTELCFVLGDWWLWGSVGLVIIVVTARLFLELARLNDKINMAKEIIRTACAWFFCFALYFPLLILGTFDVVELPRQLGLFVAWSALAMTHVITFVIEPRRRHGEVSCWKKNKIAIVVNDARAAAWRERWHNTQVIMSHPFLDQAFEKHAQDYLCSESFDFIKEVGCYVTEAEQNSAEHIFTRFRNIVDVYISAGSKLEINIEATMRNRVLEIGDRAAFLEATFDRQRDVFNPPRTEITKILNENLVHSFWTRQLFFGACKQWEENQGAEASTTMEARLLADEGNPDTADGAVSLVQAMKQMQGSKDPARTLTKSGAQRIFRLD